MKATSEEIQIEAATSIEVYYLHLKSYLHFHEKFL